MGSVMMTWQIMMGAQFISMAVSTAVVVVFMDTLGMLEHLF